MTWGKLVGGLVALAVVLALALFAVAWFDPVAVAGRAANAPWRVWTWRAVIVAFGAGVAGCLIGCGMFVLGVALEKIVKALTIRPEHGIFPTLLGPAGAMMHPAPNNVPQAQVVAALAEHVERLPAGATNRLLPDPAPDGEMLALPEPAVSFPLEPSEILDVDPVTRPHWALIGETGSGKTSATYLILDHLRRRLSRAEFVICELDGINWNQQATAVTADGYARALATVEAERLRRVELLRAADVDHISRLPDPPPYLVLLIEEADSIYQALALQDRAQAQAYITQLRALAGLGRKEGILLVLCMTTGVSQVFDGPTRKNLANKLFFRTEAAVGDAWGIPRDVGLARLPTGTAYAVQQQNTVRFPRAGRPVLPLSRLCPPERLLLPADGEADGLGPADQPDGGGALISRPAVGRPQPPRPLTVALPENPQGAADFSMAQRRYLYRRYLTLGSINAVVWEGWQQKGGVKFYAVRQAIDEMKARRGQAVLTQETGEVA